MSAPRPAIDKTSLQRFIAPLRAGLGQVGRIGFGALAVYLLIRTGALKPELLALAVRRHPVLYLVSFLLYFFVLQAFACGRWYWLLRSARVPIRAGEVIRLHMTGLFFSGFLPGGTGGDLVKGYYLMKGRSKADGAAALGTLVVDRIVGLFGLIGVATVATLANIDVWRDSPLLGAQSAFILALGLVSLVLTAGYLSPWNPFPDFGKPHAGADGKPRGFLSQVAGALTTFRKTPGVFLGTIALSMAVHFCLIAVYALCARALDVELPLRLHAYVGPILTFVNGIPISPAGLGVGETAGRVLYKIVGATHGQAEIPALVHTLGLLTALLCAPAYLLRGGKKK
jgi:uncharacterized membrane protein YbhN (UPF0104 family)